MAERITNLRKQLTEYVETIKQKSYKTYGDELKEMSERRKIEIETLKEHEIFYVKSEAQLILPKYTYSMQDFGLISKLNGKPIYSNRYVMPIKDHEGMVMALVGYSFDSEQKYMFSTTKYFNRKDSVYGLENLSIAHEKGCLFVTEGLMDAIRLRELGYKNSIASLGAHKSLEHNFIFDMQDYVIFIPDRDRAGVNTNKYWQSKRFTRLIVPIEYKDIDEFIRENENGKEITINVIDSIVQDIPNHKSGGRQIVLAA